MNSAAFANGVCAVASSTFARISPPTSCSAGMPLIGVQHATSANDVMAAASLLNEAKMRSPASGVKLTNAVSSSYCHCALL